MDAIVIKEPGKVAGIEHVAVPLVRPGWVLVKVKAVAVNPTDWKHIDYGAADPGSKVGCEYAGIVEEVGDDVTNFEVGDRIAGFATDSDRLDHENGAFGAYLIAKACMQYRIPEHLSFNEAATLGVAITTVGQGLYKTLKLPFPTEPTAEPIAVLIYGASTATGLIGVQYAKASGLTVIATASPRNFAYLKELGADAVFDYSSPSCAHDIKTLTANKLVIAWDCTGTGVEVCAKAMSDTERGRYATINPVEGSILNQFNPMVDGPYFTLGYDALGEPYSFMGKVIEPKVDEMDWSVRFLQMSEELLRKDVIRPVRLTVNQGGEGLDGILNGLDQLRANQVSARKLVYTF